MPFPLPFRGPAPGPMSDLSATFRPIDRPFPPSPRRRALARAAGVILDSPALTAAAAVTAGIAALGAIAAGVAVTLRASAHATLATATDGDVVARARATSVASIAADVLAAAGPLVLACTAGALAATAALARGLVVPRRRIRGAPSVPAEPATDATLAVARAAAIAAVAAAFFLTHGAALAALAAGPTSAAALRSLALTALAHVAVAAVLAAAVEVVVRHRRREGALRMTAREARDDAREAALDPQARRRLRDARAHDPRDHLRDAALLLVGADAVVALRYAPGMAAPTVLTTARGIAGRQLVAAARQRAVPALADDALAESLATARTVPPAHHAAVARALASL